MRVLGMHETVMEVMVNVLGGDKSQVRVATFRLDVPRLSANYPIHYFIYAQRSRGLQIRVHPEESYSFF